MAETSTFPLRLPRSMKLAVQDLAQEDGVSLNQFVATAVAEKLAAMRTVSYFAQHEQSADLVAFRSLLRRKGGQAPQPGDEILP
jgi:hypothetical protein